MNYYEITNTSPEYSTLGDFISDGQSIAYPKGVEIKNKTINEGGKNRTVPDWDDYAKQFINFKNSDGISNLDRILGAYCEDDKINEINNSVNQRKYSKIPIKEGIKFVIPYSNVDRASLLTTGIEVVSNNVTTFKASQLALLEADKGYESTKTSLSGYDTIREKYPDLTVWVWCRSLSNTKGERELNGQIFDVSPFVQNINTKMSKTGGSFTITLSPLMCFKNSEGVWQLEGVKENKNNSSTSREFITDSSMSKRTESNGSKETKATQFLFHNIISSNDLVFIRFETLDMERKQRIADYNLGFIDTENLPNKIYDMIGLVNRNTKTSNYQNNDASITINGTDLSKLLLEDGTYFYAFEQKAGTPQFAGSSTSKSDLTRRLISDNSLQYLSLYFNTSIERIIQFVIQQLATIKIVPNNLFEAYGDRRNQKYIDSNPESFKSEAKSLEVIRKKGIEKVKQIRIFEEVSEKDDNQVEDGICSTIFENFIRFIVYINDADNKNTLNEKIVIRDISDKNTIGWTNFVLDGQEIIQNALPPDFVNKYGLINPLKIPRENVKKFSIPTATMGNKLIGVKSNFKTYDIVTDQNINTTKIGELIKICDEYIDKQREIDRNKTKAPQKIETANGIWQIVKLVIDKEIAKRRIVDSSISSANGSLMNFIKKCCQEPFVEFYADTYGDMYYLIVRKPPYDKISIQSMLNGQYRTEEGSVSGASVIDIDSSQLLSDTLYHSDTNVTSWYHFTPQNSFYGGSEQYALAVIPAVFFEEYAEIWGSKTMDRVNNYTPYIHLDSGKESNTYIQKQAYEDLRYMIESSAYLPFTRQGTINIQLDRRIKIGNIIRLKTTDEIFFVDDVTHNMSIADKKIDATTIVTVSRGMVEKYISGVKRISEKDKKEKIFSYFTIINTEPDYSKTKTVISKTEENVKTQKITTFSTDENSSPNPYITKRIPFDKLSINDETKNWIKKFEIGSSSIKDNLIPTDRHDAKPPRATVGYGSTYYWDENPISPIPIGAPAITVERAETLFQKGLEQAERKVKKAFSNDSIGMTYNQYSALVSYVYQKGNLYEKDGTDVTFYKQVKQYIDSISLDSSSTTLMQKDIYKKTLEKRWLGIKYEKGNKRAGLNQRRLSEWERFINQTVSETVEETEEVVTTYNKDTVLDEQAVLSKMKVDKEIFNFFLRKQQFDN